MMWNKGLSAQTITSSTFSASANTYYTLKFSYKTISDSLDEEVLNIYVLDNNNTVLFEKYGLYSTTWSDYSLTIRTSDNAQTLKIKIELGTEDKKVSGVAYFDNFEVNTTTLSNDAYTTLVQTSDVIDFTNAGFNLKASEIQNGVYRPLTYTSKLESGSNSQTGLPVAFGGLINSENNDINLEANPKNTSLIKNVLMIKNTNASTYSFTSNNSITLTENTYYKFSVYILTKLPHNESEEIYGAEFSLDGIDAKIEGIINDDYVEYVIYVKTQSEATVKPRFALTADCLANTGSAFFDTFTYETISAKTFLFCLSSKGLVPPQKGGILAVERRSGNTVCPAGRRHGPAYGLWPL